MAGRRKQPIDLIAAKGRKHLTYAEYDERKSKEIQAPNDDIKAPDFLTKKEVKKFDDIAGTLKDIGIMTNLDCDILGMYIQSYTQYCKVTKELRKIKFKIDKKLDIEEEAQMQHQYGQYGYLSKLQIRYRRECTECAKELGLTISSRCKLVMPVGEDGEKPKNKFITAS